MRKIARTTCGLNDGIIDILFEYATLRFHKWMNAGVYVSKKIHLVPIKCIKVIVLCIKIFIVDLMGKILTAHKTLEPFFYRPKAQETYSSETGLPLMCIAEVMGN
mmetsp:Transcript_26753/g.37333  ORF Transcript_26753/g.37333 Transcript_26753/m.37333 type:complete len:105 (-) Transcript_26753:225-539(-)